MTTSQKHGVEVGRFEMPLYALMYMSDGAVLIDEGHGAKLLHALIPPQPIEQVVQTVQRKADDFRAEFPGYEAYRRAIVSSVPLSHRKKLHTVIATIPTNPDRVWSKCCGPNAKHPVALSREQVVELCHLYLAMIEESNGRLEAKAIYGKGEPA